MASNSNARAYIYLQSLRVIVVSGFTLDVHHERMVDVEVILLVPVESPGFADSFAVIRFRTPFLVDQILVI